MQKKFIIKMAIMTLLLVAAAAMVYKLVKNNKEERERALKFESINDLSLLSVSFLDVGPGDCTLIKDDEDVMLIDCGGPDYYEQLCTFLESHKVKKIKTLVLTNTKAEHIANAANVINEYDVEEVYMPIIETTDSFYDSLRFAMEVNNIKINYPQMNDEIKFGGSDTIYRFLGPHKNKEGKYANVDSYSLILMVSNIKDTFLFASDGSEEEAEDILLRTREPLKTTVYKVADHGSYGESANTKQFLETIAPEYAIITDHVNNTTSEDLLRYFKQNNIVTYKMSEEKTLNMISTGYGIIINE